VRTSVCKRKRKKKGQRKNVMDGEIQAMIPTINKRYNVSLERFS